MLIGIKFGNSIIFEQCKLLLQLLIDSYALVSERQNCIKWNCIYSQTEKYVLEKWTLASAIFTTHRKPTAISSASLKIISYVSLYKFEYSNV